MCRYDTAYVDTLFGHQSDVLGVAPQRRERVVTVVGTPPRTSCPNAVDP